MTIPSTKPAAELLIAALAAGDARIQYSFRRTLDLAIHTGSRAQCEELDALAGILDGLDSIGEANTRAALEPTLRHLLTRVL